MMWKFNSILVVLSAVIVVAMEEQPEYIKQCSRSDPELTECLKGALHHLKPYLQTGIPEIEMPSIEPFVMDALSLQLTGGPQGYRITLKHMEVFGASEYTVKKIKLSQNGKPFEARITIPKLTIKAKYTSSGVLIIIPASGNGEFDAVFDGVIADVKGTVSLTKKPDGTYMKVEDLLVDLTVKKPHLSVSKIFNNNRILTEATNLFLKENGGEVLNAMKPQLQKKLSTEFAGIANALLKHVPIEKFLID